MLSIASSQTLCSHPVAAGHIMAIRAGSDDTAQPRLLDTSEQRAVIHAIHRQHTKFIGITRVSIAALAMILAACFSFVMVQEVSVGFTLGPLCRDRLGWRRK